MNLRASFLNGKAVIVDEGGEMVLSYPAQDEREAQIRCMSNADTRRDLTNKLNTLKLKLTWVPSDKMPPVPDPEPEEKKDVIYREVPVPISDMEAAISKLIDNLRTNDIKIEAEGERHKEEMKILNADQESIKQHLYDARDGKIYETVECKIVPDYEAGVKRVVRTDTGEVVEEVELTLEEKQLSMLPKEEVDSFPIQVPLKKTVKVEVTEGGEWKEISPKSLKQGDIFRIIKNGKPVNVDGKDMFITVSDAIYDKLLKNVTIDSRTKE